MWPFSWFKKQREKHETVEEVYEKRGVNIHERPPVSRGVRGRIERRYSPAQQPPPQQNSGDALMTGFLLGELMGGSQAAPPLVEDAPAPVEFGGGESGGAGASGSWDAPADSAPSCSDTTTDSSSSDSSSSCDSDSSDSGSTGGDF